MRQINARGRVAMEELLHNYCGNLKWAVIDKRMRHKYLPFTLLPSTTVTYSSLLIALICSSLTCNLKVQILT